MTEYLKRLNFCLAVVAPTAFLFQAHFDHPWVKGTLIVVWAMILGLTNFRGLAKPALSFAASAALMFVCGLLLGPTGYQAGIFGAILLGEAYWESR